MTHTASAIGDLTKLSDSERLRWAYLALTGKLENAVRDQLAFSLQSRHANLLVGRDLAVHRRQRRRGQPERYDMVIFEGAHIVEVMEAKQFWTFDCRQQGQELTAAVRDAITGDLSRLTALNTHGDRPAVQMLNLVCWCVPEPGTPQDFELIAKYGLHREDIQNTPAYTVKILACLNAQRDDWHFEKLCGLDLGLQFGLRVHLAFIVGSPRR